VTRFIGKLAEDIEARRLAAAGTQLADERTKPAPTR